MSGADAEGNDARSAATLTVRLDDTATAVVVAHEEARTFRDSCVRERGTWRGSPLGAWREARAALVRPGDAPTPHGCSMLY
jgi:hypothetical protein